MTGFTKQTLLGILLVVFSASSSSILTEALRTSRGVRGLSQLQSASSEAVQDHLEREKVLQRIRARERSAKGRNGKGRKAKEDKDDKNEEEEEDEDEEDDDKNDDKEDKNEDEEAAIIEEAVQEEIFMEDGDAGIDDNTDPNEETETEPEPDDDTEPEPNIDEEAVTELETPPPTDPNDDANEPDTDGEPDDDGEAVEEPATDDAEEVNSIPEETGETMPPEDTIVTDAPTYAPTDAPTYAPTDAPTIFNMTIPDFEIIIDDPSPEPETAQPETTEPEPEVGSFTVVLSPFSIAIDNVQLIDTDPGIMIYLHTELKKSYDNLVSVDMIFDPSTVENRNRRKLISQLLSYYDGYAIFEGAPRLDAKQVQDSQAEIISDQDAIEAVIAESLGMGAPAFTVSSIQVEDGNGNSGTDSGSASDSDNDEGGISVAGLVIATVAACIGAMGFTAACFFLMNNPDPRNKPVAVERGYSLPPKDETPEKEGVLNRTMDTEDDHDHADDADDNEEDEQEEEQVYQEFAENIVKHDFEGDWKGPAPVQPTVSVMRGTLVETSSFDRPSFDEEDEKNAPSDEELSTTNPDDLKRELGEQLSELQASVKAAREKTQLLLDQGRGSQSPGQQSTDRA